MPRPAGRSGARFGVTAGRTRICGMSETEIPAEVTASGTPTADPEARYVEVWNDLVSPRDLTWSIVICAATTALALGIATALHVQEFFWGLGGAVLGFVVSAVVFTPKREVRITGQAGTGQAA